MTRCSLTSVEYHKSDLLLFILPVDDKQDEETLPTVMLAALWGFTEAQEGFQLDANISMLTHLQRQCKGADVEQFQCLVASLFSMLAFGILALKGIKGIKGMEMSLVM